MSTSGPSALPTTALWRELGCHHRRIGGEEVTEVAEDDIEFIPTDELVEAEPAGLEDDAVQVRDGEQPEQLMTLEDAGFEAEEFEEAQAEELEVEADEAGAEAAEAEPHDEHEEDLEEIVRRHYGIVGEEPDEELAADEATPRGLGPGEFVCRSCFLRKSASQMSDPARRICVDCAANATG